MKKQPAKINYFFRRGYLDLITTIVCVFVRLKDDIADAWDFLADGFEDFFDSVADAIKGIFTFEFEWDEIGESIKGICKFGFGLAQFLCVLTVTTSLSVFLSLVHVVLLAVVMSIVYVCFMFLWIADGIFRSIKKISSNCPNCQQHFALPIYLCPSCGAEHTQLSPSKYGILKRKCECGCKMPTTFFNGRGKIDSKCPSCGFSINDGGQHVDISIPVIGGASSGKTCFINQAITEIGNNAPNYSLDFTYFDNGKTDYQQNLDNMSRGNLPEKTNDMRLNYYQFYLTPTNVKLKNLISLCDVGGEVYADGTELGSQIGFKHANAFLLVVDPLSITAFREEVAQHTKPELYGYSVQSVDDIITMLISTLENMFSISSKAMLKTDVAVVFSKGDIPGLDEKIGTEAVKNYLNSHPEVNKYDAQNIVCENFLREYEEVNFLNSLKSKFRTIQFFTASALGHNADGSAFKPFGVEDPVLWLIDKISASIDLKDRWGKKL